MIKRRKKKLDEVYAVGQYICMSAHKARRVIDQIRGRSYEETLMILELMPYRACYPIFKLVYSAAANASHNKGFNEANLFISKAEVNEGTTVKRLKPRARGRSYLIKKADLSYNYCFERYILLRRIRRIFHVLKKTRIDKSKKKHKSDMSRYIKKWGVICQK
uniref:Large ribosomal subunit protein uL22c n=1 Tax=Commiphora gileadensis TaxID=1700993 RepID=A0A410PAB3_9ROSI|nr:ribosomal protein L22 [Commiphora gileadensis]QAT19736.1 ribosomal protein L22 [Commiphora gileadensis]